jgi:hypothetical protein
MVCSWFAVCRELVWTTVVRRIAIGVVPLLLSACAQDVGKAPRATVARLQRNTVPADPENFPNGQLRLRYRWKLPPGCMLRLPMNTDLGIPAISGAVNGGPIPLILDTGNAFPLLLDASSAGELEIPVVKGARARGTGIGGNVDVLMARYHSVDLGGRPALGDGVAGVFLHSYRKTFAGVTVSETPLNLLGLPLLEQFSFVALDAPAEEIRLGYKRANHPPANAVGIPFTISDGRMWLVLRIAGTEVRAFFDSGCGSGLRLPEAVVKKLPKAALKSQLLRKRKAMGVGGVETEQVGQLHGAYLGQVRIEPLEFDTSPGTTEALLGWAPFKKNRITIDFIRRKIWVEPQTGN